MMLSKKSYLKILLAGIVLIAALMTVALTVRIDRALEIPLDSWISGYASYSESGWYVDHSMTDKRESYYALYGPYIEMKKGSYTAEISYKTNIDRTLTAYANGDQGRQIVGAIGILSKNSGYATYDFEIKRDISEFELLVSHDGNGSLSVYSITVRQNSNLLKRGLTIAAMVIFALLVLLYSFTLERKKRTTLLGLIAISLLSVLPQILYSYGGGHDFRFHLMRIEGIAVGLQNGEFPVKMSSVVLDGYGYPTPIYYGDILLYFPAILRHLGFSLMSSYNVFLYGISLLTVFISYFSFSKIFKSRAVSIILTMSYLLASYRFENVYIRAAVGEYCAMAFLPLIAYSMYEILSKDTGDKKEYMKKSIPLAIGMSGLILTHVLTTEMVVFVLALVCIIMIRRTIRPQTLLVIAKAVLETALISLFFIVPFIDYYLNVDVSINQIINSGDKLIQGAGIRFAQLFQFTHDIVFGEMFLTVGIPLLATILFSVIVIALVTRLKNKKIILHLTLSLLFIFMATRYFPWNWLSGMGALGNLLAQIQFPWRFLGIATVFLVLLLGEVLVEIRKKGEKKFALTILSTVALTMASLSIFTVCFIYHRAREQNHQNSVSINRYSIGFGEYVLTDGDRSLSSIIYSGYNDGLIHYKNAEQISLLERRGTYFKLYLKTGEGECRIRMPLYNYKGFTVRDKNGDKIEVFDGENKSLSFDVRADYEGEITVSFEEAWYWRVSEVISLLYVSYLVVKKSSSRIKSKAKRLYDLFLNGAPRQINEGTD